VEAAGARCGSCLVHPDGSSVDVTPGRSRRGGTVEADPRSAAGRSPTWRISWRTAAFPTPKPFDSVRADGDFMVVATSLTDENQATQLWEASLLALDSTTATCSCAATTSSWRTASVVAAPNTGLRVLRRYAERGAPQTTSDDGRHELRVVKARVGPSWLSSSLCDPCSTMRRSPSRGSRRRRGSSRPVCDHEAGAGRGAALFIALDEAPRCGCRRSSLLRRG